MTTNTRHTPGPWNIIIKKYDTEPKEIVIGVGKITILDESTYTEQIVDMIIPDTNADYIKEHDGILANAKLIAAAPEMLEALKVAREEMQFRGSKEDGFAMKAVNEALKKAGHEIN